MPAQYLRAGALIRGSLRLALAREGIDFTETKSLLESVFVIHESPEVYHRLVRAVEAWAS